MSQDYHSESNRESSPDDDFSKRSILSKIDKSVLKRYKLSVMGFTPRSAPFPLNRTEHLLDRTIDDPSKICAYVHQRKSYPPQIPIFGPSIKVNQEFTGDRKVLHSGTKKKQPKRERNRTRSRSRRPERRSSKRSTDHSRSRNRERRSESKGRSRRRSRSRSTSRKYRSKSRERRHSRDKHKSRGSSRHSRKSRSHSRSAGRSRRRSISPLQPGEYRPGHPDLALSVEERRNRRPRSSSPSGSSDRYRSSQSTVSSSERSRSTRSSRSPHKRDREHSRPASTMLMPTMDFGFYDGYNPMPMHPYRAQFPMMDPHFYYPRMYPPGMMMPRMPMGPMMHRMLRPRLSVYHQGNKHVEVKPVTGTTEEQRDGVVIEETSASVGPTERVTSTEKNNEDEANVTEKKND
ncbi:uncharacterized protein [Euwallacea fornicatus]|uniref:uncharacterized protein isoform X1 n=2 Tax=Euwallacea fornicatus TaxID=995702 RepID=UPI00338DB8AA